MNDQDIAVYLRALPERQIIVPPGAMPKFMLEWRWKPLLTYNGFTHEERVKGWKLSRWLEMGGAIAKPDRCDICGATSSVSYHSEDYYDFRRVSKVCRPCHQLLHRRVKTEEDWIAWRNRITPYIVTGEEWFAVMAPYEPDIAGYNRRTFGDRVTVLTSAVKVTLPDQLRLQLPIRRN